MSRDPWLSVHILEGAIKELIGNSICRGELAAFVVN